LWNDVRIIHSTGIANSRPMTHASTPSSAAFLGGLRWTICEPAAPGAPAEADGIREVVDVGGTLIGSPP
jgi:hypothetical protein